MNSLPGIKTRSTINADEVQLLFSGKPNNLKQSKAHAETSLKRMKDWYNKNGLKMNINKTQHIIFATSQFNKRKLSINNSQYGKAYGR